MKKEQFDYLQELLLTLHTALDAEDGHIAFVIRQGKFLLRILRGYRLHYWKFEEGDYDLTVNQLATRILGALDKIPE